MATQYGLTLEGFNPKPQQIIVSEINSSLQTTFGGNINLGAESVFGQIVGIFSEREALIWQLCEAIYASQYPTGAEGLSVDNILALNNLQRLPATPTVTNPTPVTDDNDITLYGAVVWGTPGTSIPFQSLVQTSLSPTFQFKTDAAVVIGSPANAIQSVFLSATPNSGAYALTFTEGPKLAGNVFANVLGQSINTPAIPYNAISNQTQINFSAGPASGVFKIQVTQCGAAPVKTAAINWNDSAATIQGKIAALSGFSGVIVTGTIAAGLVITWGAITHPLTAVTDSTLNGGITAAVIDSIQALVNNLEDANNIFPFSDVTASGFMVGIIFTFGGLASPFGSNPSNINQPIPLIKQDSNTLMNGSTVVNMNIVMTTVGNGIGVANVGVTPVGLTCTVDGPNFIAAGQINSIGSPTAGWTGVYNELDCEEGSNAENDTEALQRRSTLLAAQANGPLQAIVEKVREVSGVTQAIGFQNLTNAAQQTIKWTSVPGSGTYTLQVGSQITGSLGFGATAAQIQTAIRLLTGYSTVLVTGDYTFGFVIDFNGANGQQAVPLYTFATNTTGVSAVIAFGRPPHSFEIVVEGGIDSAIAQVIYGSDPAGIGSYGSTTVQIFDAFDNPINISFSRPIEVPIYVTINLITDTYNIPGNTGSGANPKALWNPQSVSTIQQDIIAIGNAIQIGGLIIGFGTNGLIGAFNAVPGIVSYTLDFDQTPNPVQNANIQMQAEQAPSFETFNVIVSFT